MSIWSRSRATITSRATSKVAGAVVAVGLATTLSGCGGGGLYDLPLPGGADVGDDPVTVTADFSDVVDLVPQSSVKVDNIAVGRVSDIELNPDGRSAKVSLLIRRDLRLPEDTSARLQQTSLLGEKYVALVRPTGETTAEGGKLEDGAHIGLAQTSQVAEIEQVLGAVSMVLNGGAVGKFQEISRELQQVSDGRPEEIRGFLRSTKALVAGLDNRKEAITAALDALNNLSKTLEADKDKIATALEGLSPGMQVLVDQRSELVAMLESMDKLGQVTTRTLDQSQEDMIEDFKLLEPILKNLADAGDALPKSLEMLLTYPFPDAVLSAIKGDYINVFVTTNYGTLPKGCAAMGCFWPQDTEWAIDAMPSARKVDGDARRGAVKGKPAGAPSASASPSATPGTKGTQGTKGAQDGDSTKGEPESSESAQGETPAPSASAEPSPSLLPPTDSPLPGIGEQTVQVPRSDRPASPKSAADRGRNGKERG